MRLELPSFDERSSLQWRLVVVFSGPCLPRHFNNFSSTSKVVLSMELMPDRDFYLRLILVHHILHLVLYEAKSLTSPVCSFCCHSIFAFPVPRVCSSSSPLTLLSISVPFLVVSLLWLRWTQTHSLLRLISSTVSFFFVLHDNQKKNMNNRSMCR